MEWDLRGFTFYNEAKWWVRMLKSFDGAHGHQMAQRCTPEEIVLWLPCQAGRIQKTSLYAHLGLSYIAEWHFTGVLYEK